MRECLGPAAEAVGSANSPLPSWRFSGLPEWLYAVAPCGALWLLGEIAVHEDQASGGGRSKEDDISRPSTAPRAPRNRGLKVLAYTDGEQGERKASNGHGLKKLRGSFLISGKIGSPQVYLAQRTETKAMMK